MNEVNILNTKIEYTGKAYKVTITFAFDADLYTVTGFSDMMSLAEMYAHDAINAIVYQ